MTKMSDGGKSSGKTCVIIRDAIYVPVDATNTRKLKREYTKFMYDEPNCRRCEHRVERHSYHCDTCEAFRGKFKLYKLRTIGGQDCIGLPLGDRHNFEQMTGLLREEVQFVDKRRAVKFDYPIQVTIPLRDYQQLVVDAFLKKGYGLIEAPPRTGKSLMLLYCCIKLGLKTVILASQREFLTQFLDHIRGNEPEGIPKCTNLPELEKKAGKLLYGFPTKDEDYQNFQIMTMTYQQFLHERGAERLKLLNRHIGTLAVDETHKGAASEFAKVISTFNVKHKMGVTATVNRKDGMHFMVKAIIGPVVARSTIESLTPVVYVHKTDVKPRAMYSGNAGWVRAMQFLSKSEARNKMIVEQVISDLKQGHNIVIPVQFKNHVLELQTLINKAWGSRICEIFVGGGTKQNLEQRKTILQQAKANTTRVIVGIRSLLQLGLNVPSWSAIYTVIPISNEPNYRQETSRVRTPMPGKQTPIIRLFVDPLMGQSLGCARNCVKQMRGFGYAFSQDPKQLALVADILANTRREHVDEHSVVRTGF